MDKTFILDSSALKYLLESFPRKAMSEMWGNIEKNFITRIKSSCETEKILIRELYEVENIEYLNNYKDMFIKLDNNIAKELVELLNSDLFKNYEKDNKDDLNIRRLTNDIPFLVAIAKTSNYILVYRKTNMINNYLNKIINSNIIKCIEIEDMLKEFKY